MLKNIIAYSVGDFDTVENLRDELTPECEEALEEINEAVNALVKKAFINICFFGDTVKSDGPVYIKNCVNTDNDVPLLEVELDLGGGKKIARYYDIDCVIGVRLWCGHLYLTHCFKNEEYLNLMQGGL